MLFGKSWIVHVEIWQEAYHSLTNEHSPPTFGLISVLGLNLLE